MSGIRDITNNPNSLLGEIEGDLYNEIIEDLRDDFGITLTEQEVSDIIEAEGISLVYSKNYAPASLIAEFIKGE